MGVHGGGEALGQIDGFLMFGLGIAGGQKAGLVGIQHGQIPHMADHRLNGDALAGGQAGPGPTKCAGRPPHGDLATLHKGRQRVLDEAFRAIEGGVGPKDQLGIDQNRQRLRPARDIALVRWLGEGQIEMAGLNGADLGGVRGAGPQAIEGDAPLQVEDFHPRLDGAADILERTVVHADRASPRACRPTLPG